MRHFIHISRKKLLSQMIFGNIAIAVTAIVAVVIVAVYTSSSYINNKFISTNKAQLDYNVAQIESELERLIKVPFVVNSQNQNVQQLFKLAYSDNLLDFSTKFFEFIGLYADYGNIDSMWIYDGKQTIIDTRSGLHHISDFEEWKQMKHLCEQAKNNYTYMVPYVSETDTNQGYHNRISIVSPLNMTDAAYQSGCVIINVNMSGIVNIAFTESDGKENFYVVNSEDTSEFICVDNVSPAANNIQQIMNVKNGSDIYIDGLKYNVCSKASKIIPKYVYILANPYSNISGERRGMYIKFVIAALLLSLLEAIIISRISKYIYQPFRAIFSNINLMFLKEREISEEKSFDELAVLNKYMTTLQSDLINKRDKLDKYLPIIRQNVGQKIIDGDLDDEASINKMLKECGINFYSCNYTICLFMIDNYIEIRQNTAEKVNAIKNALFSIIESEMFNDFNCICNIPQNDRVIFIIEADKDNTESRIDEAFAAINDVLFLQTGETVSMAGISNITSITDIRTQCDKLFELAEERFNLGRKANIKTASVKIDGKDAQKSCLRCINDIKNAITAKNADDAAEAVDNFVQNLKKMPSDHIKAVVLRFIYSIKSEYNGTSEADDIQNTIDDIVRYSTADELKQRLETIISDIIISMPEKTEDNVAVKVKEYIDKNLQKDLSLTYLGDVFKLTPAYLSTLFKNTHGIGVVDYINKARIEKAKKLLRDTNMSIKDISDETGFMNYNSFARVFKKYVGISAKDFKYDIQIENDENT